MVESSSGRDATSTPAPEEMTKQDYYLENVKRITEHRALALKDRPDLTGWLYDLTGGSIPHRVYDDHKVRGRRTQDASMVDIDGMYFDPNHATRLPRCDVCGEEYLHGEAKLKCWNEECVMSPIFSGNAKVLSAKLTCRLAESQAKHGAQVDGMIVAEKKRAAEVAASSAAAAAAAAAKAAAAKEKAATAAADAAILRVPPPPKKKAKGGKKSKSNGSHAAGGSGGNAQSAAAAAAAAEAAKIAAAEAEAAALEAVEAEKVAQAAKAAVLASETAHGRGGAVVALGHGDGDEGASDGLRYDDDDDEDEEEEVVVEDEGVGGALRGENGMDVDDDASPLSSCRRRRLLMSAVMEVHPRVRHDAVAAVRLTAPTRIFEATRPAKKRPAPPNEEQEQAAAVAGEASGGGDGNGGGTVEQKQQEAGKAAAVAGSREGGSDAAAAVLPSRRRTQRQAASEAAMQISSQSSNSGSSSSSSSSSLSTGEVPAMMSDLEKKEMNESGWLLGDDYHDNEEGVFGWDAATYRWHCRSIYDPLPPPPPPPPSKAPVVKRESSSNAPSDSGGGGIKTTEEEEPEAVPSGVMETTSGPLAPPSSSSSSVEASDEGNASGADGASEGDSTPALGMENAIASWPSPPSSSSGAAERDGVAQDPPSDATSSVVSLLPDSWPTVTMPTVVATTEVEAEVATNNALPEIATTTTTTTTTTTPPVQLVAVDVPVGAALPSREAEKLPENVQPTDASAGGSVAIEAAAPLPPPEATPQSRTPDGTSQQAGDLMGDFDISTSPDLSLRSSTAVVTAPSTTALEEMEVVPPPAATAATAAVVAIVPATEATTNCSAAFEPDGGAGAAAAEAAAALPSAVDIDDAMDVDGPAPVVNGTCAHPTPLAVPAHSSATAALLPVVEEGLDQTVSGTPAMAAVVP